MPYTVYLKRSAEKELEELPAKIHDRILTVLLSLKDNPFSRNAKKLHGRDGVRIRVGNLGNNLLPKFILRQLQSNLFLGLCNSLLAN